MNASKGWTRCRIHTRSNHVAPPGLGVGAWRPSPLPCLFGSGGREAKVGQLAKDFLAEFGAAGARITNSSDALTRNNADLTRRMLAGVSAIPPGANRATRRAIAVQHASPALQSYEAGLLRELPELRGAAADVESTWNRSRDLWRQEMRSHPPTVRATRSAMTEMMEAAERAVSSTRELAASIDRLAAELNIQEEASRARAAQDQAIEVFESVQAAAGLAIGIIDAAAGEP